MGASWNSIKCVAARPLIHADTRRSWMVVVLGIAFVILAPPRLASGQRDTIEQKADVIVAADGSGTVRSVQDAIARVPEGNQRQFVIRIKPGIYSEQIRVPPSKPHIFFRGEDAERTVLTFNLSNPQVGSTSASYSTYIGGNDFRAENITFENSFGAGSQAVAILIEADRAVFRNCRFLGWQDTLYAKSGRQYFRDCYIEGHVDFVFGAATAVFERCQIHSKGDGYITAQMRFSDAEPTGFVFVNCRLTGVNTEKGVYLGRPWRAYARVVFLRTEMGAHVLPAGWDNWRDPARETTAWFAEFRSRGAGANPKARVRWSRQLTAAEAKRFGTREFLKGADGWNPLRDDPRWAVANPSAFKRVTWAVSLKQRPEWYATDEATRIADNLLLYQRENGGWPKDTEMTGVLTEREKTLVTRDKSSTDTTIDNGATRTQLEFLARVISAKSIARHTEGFLRGLDFLLAAQYANGGFPQFFPLRDDYSAHITFNDDAMIGVLNLLRAIEKKHADYRFVDEARRVRAGSAVQRGIECILRTQIVVQGRRTVWCAQHDAVTFAPARARTYELVSLSGKESARIVRFLMDIESPDPQVIEAIESAVAWFERSRIDGIRWAERRDPTQPRGIDHVVVRDPKAGPLWARFYEIETNRPFFVGRDGVIKYDVAEIEHERRTGYGWYTDSPAALLGKDYPAWKKRIGSR